MNRDTQPQTIIPPAIFTATLNARVSRTHREQVAILHPATAARAATLPSPF